MRGADHAEPGVHLQLGAGVGDVEVRTVSRPMRSTEPTAESSVRSTEPPPAALPEAARSHQATAVPSSSTIRSGIASRVTPSIVVAGATPAAPNRDASTP